MKYSNLVIAIPHSSGHPDEAIGASWGDDPEVVRERDRWTDWFTDELFNSEIGDVGHSVMIEVSKRCYMDEATLAKNHCYPKLAATIRECYLRLLGRSTLDEPIRTVRGHD